MYFSALHMQNKLVLLVFLLTVFCVSKLTQAENKNFVFDRISFEKGLSQSTISSIIQDHEGFLWLGTQEGLNRFDGYNFTVFLHKATDKYTLSDNWITTILEDKEGNLWIGTNAGGLNLFDSQNNRFIRYKHDESDPNSIGSDHILALFEDQSGYIWIGTEGGGLNRFDKKLKQFDRYQFNTQGLTNEKNNDITAICEDIHGNLWWGTDGGGVYCINWKTGGFHNFQNELHNDSSLSNNKVLSILNDQHGNIWIGTNGGGLNKYFVRDSLFIRYKSDINNPSSISDDHVYVIFEDRSSNIWIGTDNGLNQYLPESDNFLILRSDPTEPTSLSDNMIRSIYQDKGGILWVGTYSGGLNKYDYKKAVFKNYRQNPAHPNSLSDRNVWAICEDYNKILWVGTNHGLNRLDRENGEIIQYFHDLNDSRSLGNDQIKCLFEDNEGELWIGTEGGGLTKFNQEQNSFLHFTHHPKDTGSISENSLRCIFEDSKGKLWVGTINGLNILNREEGKFKKYFHDPNDPNSISNNHIRYVYEDRRGAIWIGTFNGLNLYIEKEDKFISFRNNPSNPLSISSDRVLCLYEDSSNRFWLGTHGGGLNKLDRDEFLFTHYTIYDGLPNNTIYGILEDKQGNLWLSTNQGLSKFNPDEETFKNYDKHDGIQSNEFNGNAFFKNKAGEMFFGGINGLTVFIPDEVKENSEIPPLVITSLKKYDETLYFHHSSTAHGEIELSYKDDLFSFEFAALDFTNPEKNQYAYKLEGFDKDWIFCGNQRIASYTNLDDGTYIFKVRGSNNDGIWNTTGTSIKVFIYPPFWDTWWFKLLLIISLIVTIYMIITLRMKSVNAQKRRLELEVTQRTRELNQSNYELLRAKKDTDDILNNVEEGLFLLNPNLCLATGYSLALEKMFDEQDLTDQKFLKLLERKIPKEIVISAKEYLELMFKADVDEQTLSELNPLSELEMHFADGKGGWSKSKFLSFNFKRILEDERIQNLIVTVSDITEQVILTKKLQLSEERTQNQMEWLVNILHVDPALLNEFIEGAESELNYVDSLLKQGSGNGNIQYILEEIYRSIHMIKGSASLLDLKFFINLTHKFEEGINEVKKVSQIQGKDFIPLVIHLSEVRQGLKEVRKLIDRISQFHDHFSDKRNQENNLIIKSIENLIINLSNDLGKDVEFQYDDFDFSLLSSKYRLLIKEVLIQFIRNSLYHGIESPEERMSKGKNPRGIIAVSSDLRKNLFTLRVRDDGRAIQIDKIRKIASERDDLDRDEISKWDDNKIVELIFLPGFTTVEKANNHAGRGVGMDIIKKKIEKHGGKIKVSCEEGEFCEFIVQIPITKRTRKAVEQRRQDVKM
jgi:ligand-binding sensor domain-containing protein/signal transduction histidine kinase